MKSPFLLSTQITLSLGRLSLKGMLRIMLASKGRNKAFIKSAFHLLLSGSIKADTIG